MAGVRQNSVNELDDLEMLNYNNLVDAINICKNFYRLGMSDQKIEAWNKLIHECIAIKGQLKKGDIAESKLGVIRKFSENAQKKIYKRLCMKLAPESYTHGAQVSEKVKQLDDKRTKNLEDMLNLLASNDPEAQAKLEDLSKRNLSITHIINTLRFRLDETLNGREPIARRNENNEPQVSLDRLRNGGLAMKKSAQMKNNYAEQQELETRDFEDLSTLELLERRKKLKAEERESLKVPLVRIGHAPVVDNSFEIEMIDKILKARNDRAVNNVSNQTQIDNAQTDNAINEGNAASANSISEGNAASINKINADNKDAAILDKIKDVEMQNTIDQLGRVNQFNAVLSSIMTNNVITANEQEQLLALERWRGRMDQARRDNDQANHNYAQNILEEEILNRDRLRELEFNAKINEIIRQEKLDEEENRRDQARLEREAENRMRAQDREAEARMHERAMFQLEYLQTLQLGAEQKKYCDILKMQLNEVKEAKKRNVIALRIERMFGAMQKAFNDIASGELGASNIVDLPQLATPPTPTALLPEANAIEPERQ